MLTDEELAEMLGDNELRLGDAYMTAHEAVALLTELRERRAAAVAVHGRYDGTTRRVYLTGREMDTLQTLRDFNLRHAPSEVFAVLDKILGR